MRIVPLRLCLRKKVRRFLISMVSCAVVVETIANDSAIVSKSALRGWGLLCFISFICVTDRSGLCPLSEKCFLMCYRRAEATLPCVVCFARGQWLIKLLFCLAMLSRDTLLSVFNTVATLLKTDVAVVLKMGRWWGALIF